MRYADVARRHDITPPQLYQWRVAKRGGRLVDLGDEMGATSASSAIGFFEVSPITADTAPPLAAPTAVASIEIALSGGRVLKAPSSLSAAELKRLTAAASVSEGASSSDAFRVVGDTNRRGSGRNSGAYCFC